MTTPGPSRQVSAARCDWCGGDIPAGSRRDAITCSKRCRQARHRFRRDAARPPATGREYSRDMSRVDARRLHLEVCATARIGYADPPYPGMSARYYADHHDFDGEVDHAELVSRLQTFDGWALSTAARSLPYVLGLCPPGVRVASWHRGARYVRSSWPLTSWEPVIYQPARPVADGVVDTLQHVSRPRLTDPARVVGAKPAAFANWLFHLVGATAADEFVDLFPGSGGMTRAWHVFAEASSSAADRCTTDRVAIRDASLLEADPHATGRDRLCG